MGGRLTDAAALVAGAAAGYGMDAATTRLMDRFRVPGAAAGLVTAAAIYPLARRRFAPDAALAREGAAVAATAVIAAASARMPNRLARTVLGMTWAAHAMFDATHEKTGNSRLPNWYPSLCAGYDLAFGARLIAVSPRAGQR